MIMIFRGQRGQTLPTSFSVLSVQIPRQHMEDAPANDRWLDDLKDDPPRCIVPRLVHGQRAAGGSRLSEMPAPRSMPIGTVDLRSVGVPSTDSRRCREPLDASERSRGPASTTGERGERASSSSRIVDDFCGALQLAPDAQQRSRRVARGASATRDSRLSELVCSPARACRPCPHELAGRL